MSDALVEKFTKILEEGGDGWDWFEWINEMSEPDPETGFQTISARFCGEPWMVEWYMPIEVITKFPDGRYFRWTYEQGVGGNDQSLGPDSKGAYLTEVEPFEKMVTEYRQVKGSANG